jgi:hypothetical protein
VEEQVRGLAVIETTQFGFGSNSDLSRCLRHDRFTPPEGDMPGSPVMSQKGHEVRARASWCLRPYGIP